MVKHDRWVLMIIAQPVGSDDTARRVRTDGNTQQAETDGLTGGA